MGRLIWITILKAAPSTANEFHRLFKTAVKADWSRALFSILFRRIRRVSTSGSTIFPGKEDQPCANRPLPVADGLRLGIRIILQRYDALRPPPYSSRGPLIWPGEKCLNSPLTEQGPFERTKKGPPVSPEWFYLKNKPVPAKKSPANSRVLLSKEPARPRKDPAIHMAEDNRFQEWCLKCFWLSHSPWKKGLDLPFPGKFDLKISLVLCLKS